MADTVFDKVHVVNTALNKLGLEASYSIDDEAPLGGQVDLAWHGVVAEVMALANWSAFQVTAKPAEISGDPGNGWLYGWTLPADRVGAPSAVLMSVTREAYLREFMIEQGRLYTNVKPVWVRVRKATDPQYWDAAFREAFAVALAGALAVPLVQSIDLEMQRRKDAFGDARENGGGGLFGKLIAIDRAAQPQGRKFLDNDILTRARR